MPNLDLLEFNRFTIGAAFGALHAAFGIIFAAACASMVVAWISLARACPDLRSGGLLHSFVAFVLACAMSRLISMPSPWFPVFGPVMETVTTCLAVLASVMLWRSLPSRVSDNLEAVVAEKGRTIDLLQEGVTRARGVTIGLENRIEEQAVEITVANDRLRQMLDSAMDAWIAIDDENNIVLFNKAAAEMFGTDIKDAIGQPVTRFIPEQFLAGHADQVRAFKQTPGDTQRMGASPSMSLLRANGERFAAEASISHIEVGGRILATVIMRDISEREAVEKARQLLAAEVDHRAKNALAVVQAVVSLTRAATKEAFIEAVRGRISALARAHSILAENKWQGGDLFRIIAEETSPYVKPGQVRMLGSSVVVNLSAVQPISLIVHELATNAVKYGALSVDHGWVDIEVETLTGGELRLSWTERGGPPVAPPATTGFGTTLITQIANRQLNGMIDVAWLANGLRLVATLPPSTYDQAQPAALADPAPSAWVSPPVAAESPASGKVLVVEDELLISLELCDALKVLGWEIVGPATTVADAQRLIDTTPKIDVAILDINLGGELVYPVAERLRSLGVPFVYCTGYEQPSHASRRAEDTTIRKPVNMGLLTQRLSTLKRAA